MALFCTECGERLEPPSAFCSGCGARATAAPAQVAQTPASGPIARTRKWLADWLLPVNTTVTFSGTLVGAIDFLSPRVPPLPFALVFSVLALAACLLMRRYAARHVVPGRAADRLFAPQAPALRSPAVVTVLVVSLLTTSGAAWSAAHAAQGGFLATLFGVVRHAQARALSLDRVEAEQRRQTDVLVDIRDGRSLNPRRELANQGILWTESRFREALAAEDHPTIALFLQGGMKWRIHDLVRALQDDRLEVAKALVASDGLHAAPHDCEHLLQAAAAPHEHTSPSATKPAWRSAIARLCRGDADRAWAQARLQEQEGRLAEETARAAKVNAGRVPSQQCQQRLLDNGGRALFDEASRFNMHSVTTFTPRQELLATAQAQLIVGSMRLTPELQQLARRACDAEAAPVAASAYQADTVDAWKAVVAAQR